MNALNQVLMVGGPFVAIGVPYLIARRFVYRHAEQYANDVKNAHRAAPVRDKAGVR